MILRLVVSTIVGGVVTALAWWLLRGPLAAAAGMSVGVLVAQMLDDRRRGRAIGWRSAFAQGAVAGAILGLMAVWLQR